MELDQLMKTLLLKYILNLQFNVDNHNVKILFQFKLKKCGKNKRSLRELSIVLRCTGAGTK
jgi:hypothetical protein